MVPPREGPISLTLYNLFVAGLHVWLYNRFPINELHDAFVFPKIVQGSAQIFYFKIGNGFFFFFVREIWIWIRDPVT